MSEIVEVYQPEDRVYTMSDIGRVVAWRVQHDGTLEQD